jgi:hypothetical protein
MRIRWFVSSSGNFMRNVCLASFARYCPLAGALALSACIGLDPSSPEALAAANAHADRIAAFGHLQREVVQAGPFVLTAFVRVSDPSKPIRIYIEGDGLAWISRDFPSPDPTPHEATGLQLAAADTSANVVYLARPCQFTSASKNPRCDVPYWTGKRFSKEIVTAMDSAVSSTAARAPQQGIELVGYSGGGAIAVLVAAQRHDVLSIRTVAGNLDDDEVNRIHRVSAMPESEDAMHYVRAVAAIPQVHFSGTDDRIVPIAIPRSFVSAAMMAGGQCARTVAVPGLSHDGDWAKVWPALLKDPMCP